MESKTFFFTLFLLIYFSKKHTSRFTWLHLLYIRYNHSCPPWTPNDIPFIWCCHSSYCTNIKNTMQTLSFPPSTKWSNNAWTVMLVKTSLLQTRWNKSERIKVNKKGKKKNKQKNIELLREFWCCLYWWRPFFSSNLSVFSCSGINGLNVSIKLTKELNYHVITVGGPSPNTEYICCVSPSVCLYSTGLID